MVNQNEKMKKQLDKDFSDKQAMKKRGKISNQFDHELANEPLSASEKLNNKKTKKRH